jgi:hypothetical protein
MIKIKKNTDFIKRVGSYAFISGIISMIISTKPFIYKIFIYLSLFCDETVIFWRLLPCKTISNAPVIGKKRPNYNIRFFCFDAIYAALENCNL